MKIIYPSNDFIRDVKIALNSRQIIEVTITNPWRTKMLSKEIDFWTNSKTNIPNDGTFTKSPSTIFSLLNLKLIAFHGFALSADYKMKNIKQKDSIILTYSPR